MSDERRPVEAWASRLGGKGEPLTMAEAMLFTAIVQCDRLVEIRDGIQDVQARLTRIELFLAATVPGYDDTTKRLARVLAETAQSPSGGP